jgi:hypothetical protein
MARTAQSSWDRFQALLEALRPGDELHVAVAAHETGLSKDTCEHVLEALTRVDLFTPLGNQSFLRRRIFQAIDRLDTDRPATAPES